MRARRWCSTSRRSASRIPSVAAISDPGNHSSDSSLPVMRRHASALAGPGTAVFVGGKRFEVGVNPLRALRRADGGITEEHVWGHRHRNDQLSLKTRPARMAVGEQWILEGDGRVIIYRIENSNSEGKLRIARKDESGESIEAFATGDGLRIIRIGKLADVGRRAGSTSHSMKRATSASRWKARRSYRDRQGEAAGRDDRHQPFPYAAGLGRGEASPRYLLPRRRSPDRGDDDRPQRAAQSCDPGIVDLSGPRRGQKACPACRHCRWRL